MMTCPVCGHPAKAKTTERIKGAKAKTVDIVDVYHHDRRQCREFETVPDR